MVSKYVLVSFTACFLFDVSVALAAASNKPMCLTWSLSHSYLTVKCVIRDAAYDITIVDPFGINRVQCNSELSHCSKSYNTDLYFEKFSKTSTSLTLTTSKYNCEGEWKCRHGNEERKSRVSYTEGIGPMIDVVISGEVKTINGKKRLKLTCFSCWEPYMKGVDIYIDNVLEDSIRYNDGLCYHKRNQCMPGRCTCSSEGRYFTWTVISDLSYILFTCAMRFKTGIESAIHLHNASLIYNETVFIKTQGMKKVSVLGAIVIPNSTSNNEEEGGNEGHIAYSVLGGVGLIILVALLICCLRIHGLIKKKGQEDANDEESQLEVVPLLDVMESKYTPENDRNVQNRKASEKISDYIHPAGKTSVRKDVNIVCICCNQYQEKDYTNDLIQTLYKFGFRPKNIKLVYDALPNDFFSEVPNIALKLIIVLPKRSEFNNESFFILVENAVRLSKGNLLVDIFPLVRSKMTVRPSCLTNMRFFTNTDSAFKDALLQCPFEKKMNEFTSSFINQCQINFKQNRLNKIILSPNAHEYFEVYDILKGWGVEVEQNRISFHMKILQSQSLYEPTCLHDIVYCLLMAKSLRFLKMYDVARFDLTDLKLHTHIHSQLIKILDTLLEMKRGKLWYHYRRNGLIYISPREAAFKRMKRVFLDKNVSVKFKMFVTKKSRIDTLQNFPIENTLFREKLAQAGFFYFNVSDYVQCFHCGGCLRSWMSTDDPVAIHSAIFKTCAFVMQCEDANRMIMSGVDTKLVMDSNMYSPEYRFNSFQLFPTILSHDKLQRLSKAGFYYCEIATDIVCCACNIGFAHVQNVDYIMKLHEIYSPDCPNASIGKEDFSQEYISNFVQYLELELREHDFDTLDA